MLQLPYDAFRQLPGGGGGGSRKFPEPLLVHPLYQGCGVGSRLLELCKRRYAGYLNVIPAWTRRRSSTLWLHLLSHVGGRNNIVDRRFQRLRDWSG